MKSWIVAAVMLLVTAALPGVCGSPDFAWEEDCPELKAAREKWQAAAFILPPKGSESARPQPFDVVYLRKMLSKGSFDDSPYAALDDAMQRAQALDDAKKLYNQALEQCKLGNTDKLKKSFDEACLELNYTTAITSALARAGIARKMADSQFSGYCFQAMESAIDTLTTAQKGETDKKRLESLTRLRSKLFSMWEEAQRTRNLGLIRDLDLLKAFEEAVPQHGTQGKTGAESNK